ncbi:Nucleotide-binding protein, UspA family [Halalkaliarchaeum sp. AArc-CO]|uniref:universal stress protein n=1 Tax=unclassified Halalkaliarchaeum TaxID=2678344 RepID=UPI00217DB0B3|nr:MULTISPECIES: universal stress protein [unclassified Halalkaliarchaeum]MDR5671842.1 universal stress protein [Halalkaliarchaeum sp. AArc-GB]UWG51345.1 Nucleotide-binding protein, UspA family [Halalkaliarchaeum sp. AArc-CO]
MYRMLVPVDVDETRAGAQAEAVLDLAAEMDDLQVEVLYVHEEIDAPADEAGTAYIDAINENLQNLQGLPDSTATFVDRLREAGVDADVHSVTGDPATAILELADEFQVDTIVLGARRRSPVGKVLFGSVTQSVILDSDCPVTVAPEPRTEQ